MAQYKVEIEATIRKTLTVEAESEQEASEIANGEFSVLNEDEDDIDEDYDQQVINIKKVVD